MIRRRFSGGLPPASAAGAIPVWNAALGKWEYIATGSPKANDLTAQEGLTGGSVAGGTLSATNGDDTTLINADGTVEMNLLTVDLKSIPEDASAEDPLIKTSTTNLIYLRHLPQEYAASDIIKAQTVTVAADRQKVVLPQMRLDINGSLYYKEAATTLDVTAAADWDSILTDYTVATTRRGIPIYIYACRPESGQTPDFLLSANASYPSGYTADNSRKLGTFRCLVIDIGTIASHPFSNYLCGDVHFSSVKCLKNRPDTKDFGEGMVWLGHPNLTYQAPGWWIDMYLASGTGVNTVSAFGATISDTRDWNNFVDDFAAVGKQLLSDSLFQTGAFGSPEQVNIYGSLDPVKTGLIRTSALTTGAGLNDFSIDASGWSINTYAQSYTFEIDATGTPDTFKWKQRYPNGTWGSYTTGVAITGNWQTIADGLKVQWTATTGHTLADVWTVYCMDAPLSTAAVPMISHSGCWAMTGNLLQWLLDQSYRFYDAANHTHEVTVSGDPQTVTSGNPSGDVAPTWSYITLSGGKGASYNQGTVGDIKMLAGGGWNNSNTCGSRSRNIYNVRWVTGINFGARGCARSRVVGV